MSQGHEAFFAIHEHWKGWGTSTYQTSGVYPEVDSEALTPDVNIRERDSKIRVGREAHRTTFSADETRPAGNMVIQPRTDDCIPIFMAFFQAVHFEEGTLMAGVGTGTFTFVPVNEDPDWVGSLWGSAHGGTEGVANDVYPIMIKKCFDADWTNKNGEGYTQGLVDTLEFSQPFGEDLTITPGFKFRTVALDSDWGVFEPPCAYGSYSEKARFVDWKGTIAFTYGGNATTLELDNITVTLNNNTSDKGKIGYKGWSRFPFSGRPVFEGSLDLELVSAQRDLADIMADGGSATLSLRWFNSLTDQMLLEFANIHFRTFDRPVSAGDTPVEYSLPFRAYPTDTEPGVKLTVWSQFATSLFTVHAGSGTAQA